MSIFAAFNPFEDVPGVDPGVSALLNQGLRLYQREKIGEKALGAVLGDEDRDLDRESRRLDNALKRRQLGMPMNDSELEDSSDNRTPFFLRALGGAVERIPEPGFLRPKMDLGTFPLRPLAKGIGNVADRSLPGFLRAFRR